jgi:hypothetical protein
MTGRRVARVFAAACALSVALASCSHSARHAAPVRPSGTAPRGDVFVAIGSNATIGDGQSQPLLQSWPQLLFRQAFPISTVFVNAGEIQESARRALTVAVPLALEVHATVVAIWIGDWDLRQTGSAANFEANLDLIVRTLRNSGARVLIGNFSRTRPGAAAFDDAIARVARARSATLVDLATAVPTVGPSSKVNPATSRAIATAFTSALTSP